MLRYTCIAFVLAVATGLQLSANLQDHWTKFKSAHNKDYSSEEEAKRKEIFKQNVEQVLSHNLNADLGEHSHKLSINEFCDLVSKSNWNSYHAETSSARLPIQLKRTILLKLDQRRIQSEVFGFEDANFQPFSFRHSLRQFSRCPRYSRLVLIYGTR